jgi:hypothetical protein
VGRHEHVLEALQMPDVSSHEVINALAPGRTFRSHRRRAAAAARWRWVTELDDTHAGTVPEQVL